MVHETGRATKELLHGRCTTWRRNEEYRPETDGVGGIVGWESRNAQINKLIRRKAKGERQRAKGKRGKEKGERRKGKGLESVVDEVIKGDFARAG